MLSSAADFFTSGTTPRVDTAARKRIGEILIERGKVDAAGLERALRVQQESGEKLGALLVTLGVCAQRDVTEALAAQLGLPLVDAAGYPEFPILEERISARFLREARALPVREDENELALAMADPTDEYTIGAFRMVTGRDVKAAGRDPQRARRGARAPVRRRPHRGRPDHRRRRAARRRHLVRRRRAAAQGPRVRGAGDPPRFAHHHQRARCARLRHPYRAVREPARRPLPDRRRAARGRVAAAPLLRCGDLAHQDHGEPRHRRTAAAAGRPHPAARAGQGDRSSRLDGADDARRVGGDADPRQGRRARSTSSGWASRTTR